VKFRRLKPGSLLADGSVVDWFGNPSVNGVCFIPGDFGATWAHREARCNLLNAAGWRFQRDPRFWPGIPPVGSAICIGRVS
jgi:hypothetical protein